MRNKAFGWAFVTVLGLSLAGCGKDGDTPNSNSADVVAQPASTTTSTQPSMLPQTALQPEMPFGFVIPFPTEVLRDQTVDSGDGKQRRIQLHAPGIEPAAAEEQLAAALIAAGFKGGKIAERDGMHSVNYRKDGKVVAVVSVHQVMVDNGTRIRFGWVN